MVTLVWGPHASIITVTPSLLSTGAGCGPCQQVLGREERLRKDELHAGGLQSLRVQNKPLSPLREG